MNLLTNRGRQYLAGTLTGDSELLRAMEATDDATARRVRLVQQSAIDSSRRGDGRFLEGRAVITRHRRPKTPLEAMADFGQAMQRFADLVDNPGD